MYTNLNRPINNWNVASVNDADSIFRATNFNQTGQLLL